MFSEREFLFYDSSCEIIPFQVYPVFSKNVLDKRDKLLKAEEQRSKFKEFGGYYQSYAMADQRIICNGRLQVTEDGYLSISNKSKIVSISID